MAKTFYVSPGRSYTVTASEGTTITYPGIVKPAATVGSEGSVTFNCTGTEIVVSDDSAQIVQNFNNAGAAVAGAGGSGSTGGVAPSVTGEPIVVLSESGLTVRHATWFDNKAQSSISVQAAPWKNEVMTCYLKTAVPVELAGVTWLYGEPAMMEGFTFVVALQQVDASTVLANLAYSLKQ